MKPYTFQITDELHQKLKIISKQDQRTASATIRFLLAQYFESKQEVLTHQHENQRE